MKNTTMENTTMENTTMENTTMENTTMENTPKYKMKVYIIAAIVVTIMTMITICGLFFFYWDAGGSNAAEVCERYTDEVAKAVIESGWRVAGAVVSGALILAVLNKFNVLEYTKDAEEK